ncbi:dTDP-4-dehydrorhamnose reductase [Aliiglaciecola litoralis]|uniref:dTDP-4-dehydrorhamnose reductase n=1 Tax=Aliiglaciecola litoralis TaxID=582857 RepID=A0ABN1LJ89_9ALTE
MNIIVIGKNGQLAQALKRLNPKVICLGRNDIDVIDENNLTAVLDTFNIKGIINAAAYTAVDKAESEPEQAFSLNKTAVANLASYAASRRLHLVHVSTDYVFSGDKNSPYLVNDPHEPKGTYGASKAAGENVIRQRIPEKSCIIRTSWVYSATGNNFVKTMLKLMVEKTELAVVADQTGSPTSAMALANACLLASEQQITGVHHFTDEGSCTWYDFALAIQDFGYQYGLLRSKIPVKPIPTSAYPTPAKRPKYSVLDISTLNRAFTGLTRNHWQVELEHVIQQLAQQREIGVTTND